MTTPRPKCAHCGEPYGNRRTDNVSFKWQTWIGGYPPFCTLRCALDYARRAFKKHGRIK